MTLLYNAQYSFVLLRPKNEVKLSIVWGNGLYLAGQFYFSASERPKTFRFFRGFVCYQCDP